MLIAATFVAEVAAQVVSYVNNNNSIVYHLFVPLEYALYANIFLRLFNQRLKGFIYASIFFLVAFELANTVFFQGLETANTNTFLIESSFMVFLSIFFFRKMAVGREYKSFKREGLFVFNAAVLFYYACNFIIWGFHSYMIKNDPSTIIYDFILIFSGLLYLVYSFAVYIDGKKAITVRE